MTSSRESKALRQSAFRTLERFDEHPAFEGGACSWRFALLATEENPARAGRADLFRLRDSRYLGLLRIAGYILHVIDVPEQGVHLEEVYGFARPIGVSAIVKPEAFMYGVARSNITEADGKDSQFAKDWLAEGLPDPSHAVESDYHLAERILIHGLEAHGIQPRDPLPIPPEVE